MSVPAASLPANRADGGPRPTLGEKLARTRRRPPLVRLYAAVFSELGLLGGPSRRRGRRFLVRSVPAAVVVANAALVALGAFGAREPGWIQAGALAALALGLAGAVYRRTLGAAEGRAAPLREQLELGSLFVVAAHATAQAASAGGESVLQPLVYLVMAFLVAFLSRPAGFALVGFAVALEGLAWLGRGAHAAELPAAVIHGGFVALFAALYHAVLAAHVAAGRRAEAEAVARRLREIVDRARVLRVQAPAGVPAEEDEWSASAVVEVEAAVSAALEIAEAALESQLAAVYLLSTDDKALTLVECRAADDVVARGPLPAGEGALGAAVKTRRPVRLHGDLKLPAHRLDGRAPGALLVVPIVDAKGFVRGVVLAEREAPVAFTEGDERVLQALASEIWRARSAEALMANMRRARDEKTRLHGAIERLNKAAKPAEVYDAALDAARAMAPADVAIVTLVEQRGSKKFHVIVRAAGDEAVVKALEGREWPDEAGGLVASAVRFGQSLPAADVDPAKTPVLDPETRLRGVASLRVLPLKSAQEVVGTLVLGSRRPEAYDGDLKLQLDVVAMQAATSLDRARLFEKTERLATTDGLTGLQNHRTFQARLDDVLAQAERYGKRAALLLCDIDHFKSVNDTYGHPVGDVVLRGVAQVLAKEARTVDVVARYGGEEFAIIMPETDAAGAAVIAERIRERVAARTFETEQGPLKVTLSLGVAGYPGDADRRATLLERADACLYQAKRGGRNRVVVASAARPRPLAAG
ncbi:MAG: diguanylate cyclase [Anaeromyxobacter sp.]